MGCKGRGSRGGGGRGSHGGRGGGAGRGAGNVASTEGASGESGVPSDAPEKESVTSNSSQLALAE
eukprot:145717-Rhodomonas_salina.2